MFFAPRSRGQVIRLVDNRFIEALARDCRQGLYQQKIIVLTIALSPEYCGSWQESEKALTPFLRGLDCPFRLLRKTPTISYIALDIFWLVVCTFFLCDLCVLCVDCKSRF